MPRRKRNGAPSKRKRVCNKAKIYTKIPAGESNDDPGGGSNVLVINSSSLQAPECNQEFLPSNCKDFSDSDISDINNKYLHKKFKKIATTIPTEEKDDVLDDVNSTMNNISGREEETFSAIGKSNHSHVINSESKALFSDIQIKSADKANNSEENPSNEEILATYGSDILSCMSVSDRLQSAVSLSQGRYICPYCKLACAKPSVLQKHIRAHTNERPYPCRPCGFSFKTRSNLYKHCRSRTHALKVVGEEVNISGYVSHKTVCAIMDSSDIDDEDDDTNIVPPPSSCLSLHNACAARLQGPYTLSDISSVPRESKNNQERSRQIYKPKFHKAALYYNEEESEHCYKKESSDPRIVTSTSSPSPSFTPSQNLGMSESHVTVPSPTSEYFQWQLKTSVNEVEVKVHKNNSASVETFKRNPASSDHITESSRSPSFPSSFPAESYNYLSSSSIAAENSAVLSAASKETKKLNFFDQHTYQSKLASPQFISLECLSPCLKIGSSNMSSQKNKYFQCTQPLNLSTTDETNKGGNDTNHRKRSYSEDIPITLKTYEHHTLPNQETCENCDGHSKLNAKIAKFDQVKLLAEYEGRIETSPENAFSNSQNLKGSFMNDLLLKEQDTPAMGNLMSCSSIYNHTDILPRVALKADTFNVPFSHLASLIPSESYCPCGVGFKTVDSLDICQCLYCQKHKNYDSNCPLSQENFNPVVMCCCTQNQPLFSPILEEMREVDSLSLRGEPVTQRCCVKSQLLLKESLKNNSVSTHSSDNSKSASLVLPPIPSPGPLLGNTHLVDGYHIYEKSKNCDTNTDEFEEQNRRQFFPKRRCLDSDVSSRETNSATSSPDLRSLSITAMPKIPYTPGPVSTLKSLEELSKNPLRPNSLQMFGGEVQIVDGAGETTTMRIEPTLHGNNAGIASLNPSDVVLKLTNNLTPNNLFLNTAENNENDVDKTGRNSPHIVVTIAKSGLNSGGTIVQVPQKSSSLASANMLSANVIKSCKSPNGNMHLRDLSPLLKSSSPLQSPLQNNSVSGGGVVNISSQFECSCTKGLASNTATVTDAYPDTTKLLVPIVPNIPTPNLAVPGIPAPTFGHDMPFMPSSSVRKDRSLLNPLNDITAFNPLTLQAHSSLFYSLPQRVDSVGTKETPKENKTQYSTVPQETLVPPFPGCAVTIFHGGRYIPYVPGIPGPQSLLCNVPHKMSLKNETLPKPLDLASPSKDSKSDFLFPNNQSKNFKCHILKPSEASAITRNVTDCHNTQQSKNCFGKNTGTLSQKCDSESPAKLHVKSKSLPAKLNTSLNHSSHPSTSCESKYVLHPSPSLPFFSQNMMSTQVADIVNAMPAKRLANTKIISEPVCLSLCKKNVEINEDRINESERLCSIGERETNRIEFKSETCGTEENTEIAAKFRRPTSLPLKPETFVPIRNQSSGLMSEGTVLPLVSPETPRPKKSYGQLYLNGYVFTFLTLKISTKPFFCILTRTQPMYAMQSPENPKLSMYSDWRIKNKLCPNPLGLSTSEALSLYDSRNRCTMYTTAKPKEKLPMVFTHSSYWLERECLQKDENRITRTHGEKSDDITVRSESHMKTSEIEVSSSEFNSKKLKLLNGGFESNEEYSAIRGKDRGRYICEVCGIRCKKLSILKKHIRKHTDVRLYTCRLCNCSFKIKKNLSKHIKSKAHYKKCDDLRNFHYATMMDEGFDEEEHGSEQDSTQNNRIDTHTDENDECENVDVDDDNAYNGDEESEDVNKGHLEREAARSLLSLLEMAFSSSASTHQCASSGLVPVATCLGRPSTYPYTLAIRNDGTNNAGDLSCTTPQTPTLTAVSAQTEREKVSRYAGLALELRSQREEKSNEYHSKLSSLVHRRDNAAPLILIPPQQSDCNKYYNILQQKSANFDNSFTRSHSLAEENPEIEEDYWSGISCADNESESNAYKRNKVNFQIGFDSENSASNQQPIDLSNKSTPCLGPFVQNTLSTSNLALISPFDASCTGRALSNPISDVLAPVSEPATLIASLWSSVERCPVSTSLLADQPIPTPTDPTEANMLHAYLKERAVQNFRMRHHQCKNSGIKETPVVTSTCAEIISSASSLAGTAELMSDGQYSENEMLPILQQGESNMKEPLMHSVLFTDSTNVKTNSDKNHVFADSKKMNICTGGTPVKMQGSESSEIRGNGESGNDETKDAARMKSPLYVDCGMPNIPLVRCDTVERNGISSAYLISSPTLNTATVSPIKSPSGKAKAEFMSPSTGPSPAYFSLTEDGRSMCNICNKVFSKPSQLRLHVNIHYFERPFRCDSCTVSFRTKGHLQKHERSVSHQNKVSMNSTFGTPTTTNPRPFKCDDCKIAFRIHGHLAKHLRSKMHIMKLECVGKLPFGTYAEMEREGFNPNDIDTTDCENSLESLQHFRSSEC